MAALVVAVVPPVITVQLMVQAAEAEQVHAACAAIQLVTPAVDVVVTQDTVIKQAAAAKAAVAALAVTLVNHGPTARVMAMVAVAPSAAAAAAAAHHMAADGAAPAWCALSGARHVAGLAVIHTTYRSSHNIINEE
jgi:hypothetical protein